MPRVGRHPLKKSGRSLNVDSREITIVTITHVPMLDGYWANSLRLLDLFFESLVTSTDLKYDLMVFDNKSCGEVRNYLLQLQEQGLIQVLILSERNLRKLGALNFLLSVAPGEYIAYADSDVYFLPGWLEASLEVLDAFPKSGKVTALPIVGGDTSVLAAHAYNEASEDPAISTQVGHIVEDRYIEAHRTSIGETERQYQSRLENRKDVLLSKEGVKALLSGADFQFTIKRNVVQEVLPLTIEENSPLYFDPIYSPILEYKLQAAGYWILSLTDYLVHHLGNVPPNLQTELPWTNCQNQKNSVDELPKPPTQVTRLNSRRMIRGVLKRIHSWTYRLLYE